jgi:hypothetical protein
VAGLPAGLVSKGHELQQQDTAWQQQCQRQTSLWQSSWPFESMA